MSFQPSSSVSPLAQPRALRFSAAALAVFGLAAALSACGGASGAAGAPAARPVAVGTYTVSSETATLSTELSGRTSAPVVAEIRPQVGGLIKARSYVEGGRVQAGQALYQIDAASYQASADAARAAVDKAEATLESAQLTAQRQADLFKIQAVSQQDVQDAQATLKQARADLASAKAAADTARINLERTVVRSPIAGLADVSSVTTGALVTADQTTALTTVRQTDPIQVDVSQSSAEWLALQRDLASGRFKRPDTDTAAVQLILEDGSAYPRVGKLSMRGVSVNTSTGAVTLRAQFPNPDGWLMPGMYVRAVLTTVQQDQALLVPQQAVSRDTRNGSTVLVVGADQKVVLRPVTLDRTVGKRWLVSAGLQPGEQVIVEGGQKVRPGDTVQTHAVTPATGASSAAASSAASATSAAAAAR